MDIGFRASDNNRAKRFIRKIIKSNENVLALENGLEHIGTLPACAPGNFRLLKLVDK